MWVWESGGRVCGAYGNQEVGCVGMEVRRPGVWVWEPGGRVWGVWELGGKVFRYGSQKNAWVWELDVRVRVGSGVRC